MKLAEKMELEANALRLIFPQRASVNELAEYYGVKPWVVERALRELRSKGFPASFAEQPTKRTMAGLAGAEAKAGHNFDKTLRDVLEGLIVMGEDADLDQACDLIKRLVIREQGRLGGQKGGIARAEALPPIKRVEIGKRAAEVRWNAGVAERKAVILGNLPELVARFPHGLTTYELAKELNWSLRTAARVVGDFAKHGEVRKAFHRSPDGRSFMIAKILFDGMTPQDDDLPTGDADPNEVVIKKNLHWRDTFRSRAEKLVPLLLERALDLVRRFPNGMSRAALTHEFGYSEAIAAEFIKALVERGLAIWEDQGRLNRKVLLLEGMLRLPQALSPAQSAILDVFVNAPGASDTTPFPVSYEHIAVTTKTSHSGVACGITGLIVKGYLRRVSDPSHKSAATYLLLNPQPQKVVLPKRR